MYYIIIHLKDFKCYFLSLKRLPRGLENLEKRTASLQGTTSQSPMRPFFGGFTVYLTTSTSPTLSIPLSLDLKPNKQHH